MQQPPPPMTPFEEKATQAYQMLHQARVQTEMMYLAPRFCIDKCLDTEELYTLLRTTKAPFRYRIQKDLEEKTCVTHCAAKWDELLGMTIDKSNETAVKEVEVQAIAKLMQQMYQQQQQ